MSESKVLKRARALIARAASPIKEEARTSAYLACKLIREHDLQLSFKDHPVKQRAPKRSAARTGVEFFDDLIDDFFTPDRMGFQRIHPFSSKGKRVVITTATISGRCSGCGGGITAGTKVVWYPNRCPPEVYHNVKCSERAANATRARA